ncbi:ATP-binding protein [Clostridium sp. AF19-22AC]|jgi:predicted AAA+ superfamily ATPase|uniref:ATP-binding protein n=1 Tax=Clostridia TaxID=186801 RepID=UPI000E4CD911|nr:MULTISPECIES: ATP-binding protein [Clostridia]RHR20785.1 ATP-binding protein [Clostridium sp. AF19-22AC]
MIKRETYLKRIRGFYDKDLIKVITGIRRCGKSVLLMQIMDELKTQGIGKDQILYINFEDYDYSFIRTGMDLHDYVKSQITTDKKYYLFFDEIQTVPDFERVINSLKVKYNTSIFITGSNGKLLSGELATFLTGRYVSFRIMPFTFREMCELKQIKPGDVTDELFYDYITWGGLPQRFQMEGEEQTKTFLRDVYDAIVLKDIVQRAGIKDIELFNRIIEYLVCNPSQTFSATAISDYFLSINRKVSRETIYNYLEHITSSLIMSKASRYDIRGKRILTKLDKYYLTDMGLGRIRNSGFKLEMGALLENVVYNELLVRGYEVYVGKTRNGEIDFVAVNGTDKEYYQVAYYLADQRVIDREFGVYRQVADNYPKYVLSMDKMDFSRDGIIHQNILEFLGKE